MPLDLNTSIDFLKGRVDATLAVQTQIAGTWTWPLKALSSWQADSLQLDRSQPDTLAAAAITAATKAEGARGALDGRLGTLHAQTTRVVGIMRSRAESQPEHRHVVDELSARGDGRRGKEEEAAALLSAWKEEFGGAAFTPVPVIGADPAITFASFGQLLYGSAGNPAVTPPVPSLRDLKQALSDAGTVERRALGKLNVLLTRVEKEAQNWYSEATSVFPAGTDIGDLVRTIPTTTDYNPPTPAAPAVPTP